MSTPTMAVAPATTWWDSSHRPPGRIGAITPGIAPLLNQYAGGLEGLMAEFVSMSDTLGVPLSVFTLFYTLGYGEQLLRNGGQETVFSNPVTPRQLGLEPVWHQGRHAVVTVNLATGPCHLMLWREQRGSVTVYYLQADISLNTPENRALGYYLYGGAPGSQERLRQQLLLGFGAVAAAEVVGGIQAWQLNDPHGAWAAVARIRDLMVSDRLSWQTALRRVSETTLMTTHTPVPDGMDRFPWELVDQELRPWAEACGDDPAVMLDRLREVATFPGKAGCNMLALGVRTSDRINGVSERHAAVTREILLPLFPDRRLSEMPVDGITNGVDPRTWVHPFLQTLFERYLGETWFLDDCQAHARFTEIPPAELWRVLNQLTGKNVARVRELLRQQSAAVGWARDDLGWIEEALAPLPDGTYPLIVGWARRMTGYKRGDIWKRIEEQLAQLILDADRPVYVVVAGKAHPDDKVGHGYIERVLSVAQRQDLRVRFVYVANYDVEVAKLLVQLVRVWMNNPVPPLEASGTSGMKALLSLGLTFSVMDGWVHDFGTLNTIWTIAQDDAASDAYAGKMLAVLRDEIIPLYYQRGPDGIPYYWLERVAQSFMHFAPLVTAARMMKEYAGRHYLAMLDAAERHRLTRPPGNA